MEGIMSQVRAKNLELDECSIEPVAKKRIPFQEVQEQTQAQHAPPTATAGVSASSEKKDLPAHLQERFFKSDDTYYFPDRSPAFADKESKLVMRTKGLNAEVVRALVSVAEDRGWDKIHVKGNKEFRQAVWLEAASKGIECSGYTPTKVEQAWAEKEAAKLNAISHAAKEQRAADAEKALSQTPSDAGRNGGKISHALAAALAGISTATAAAKKIFSRADQQTSFVQAVRERYAALLSRGDAVSGPHTQGSPVVSQLSQVVQAAQKQQEQAQLASALSTFKAPQPDELFKASRPAARLTKELVEGGMTIGQATVAVAVNQLIAEKNPALSAQFQRETTQFGRMTPEEMVLHHKERVNRALDQLSPEVREQTAARLRSQMAEIDKAVVLKEVQKGASLVESPRKLDRDGRETQERYDTRNADELRAFLRSTGVKSELCDAIVERRSKLKVNDPQRFAEEVKAEWNQFAQMSRLSADERNRRGAQHIAETHMRSKEFEQQQAKQGQDQSKAKVIQFEQTQPDMRTVERERVRQQREEMCR